MKRLLVVDDDAGARASLRAIFSTVYDVELAEDADEALRRLESTTVDLVLLDVIMPRKDGVTLLRELAELYPDIPVIMISASDNLRPVVESMKSGAVDFVTKPFNVDELRHLVARVLEHHTLRKRVRALESDIARGMPGRGLVGESHVFREAVAEARRAAGTKGPILIQGAAGTGKELMARRIHDWSPRSGEPFVAVPCAALPAGSMERELFGHERHARMDPEPGKLARFELAGSGTVYLDEVGALAPGAQAGLLRVLLDQEYVRPGGARVIPTGARVIASAQADLRQRVEAGTFRKDLLALLSATTVRLPPLRDRRGDVPLLADFFLRFFRQELGAAARRFTPEALEALGRYDWPGNLRELRNVVERILVLHGGEAELGLEVLPDEFRRRGGDRLSSSVEQVERDLLIDALRKSGGVQTKAAECLGTTRRILKYKMDKHNITLPLEENA